MSGLKARAEGQLSPRQKGGQSHRAGRRVPYLRLHQPKNRDRIMDMMQPINEEHFDGCQMGGRWRGMGEEVRGLRSTNW